MQTFSKKAVQPSGAQRATAGRATPHRTQFIAEERTAESLMTSPPRFQHDLSRISIHPPAPRTIQPKTSIRKSKGDRESDELANSPFAEPISFPVRSSSPLPFLETIQQSFGHHRITHIHAHTGSGPATQARAMGAEAFAQGRDVTFLRPPSLHTAAHEAAHVVQQRAGINLPSGIGREGDEYERHADQVADRVVRGQPSESLLDAVPGMAGHQRAAASRTIQMRRIPPNIRALLTATGGGKNFNFFADEEGTLRLIDRAMEELTPAQRAKVKTRRLGTLTEAQFDALPRLERRSRYAEAILAEFSGLTLGDPNLIDIGARPATADAANITKLVNNVNTKIFASIASGARDTWLTQVFGAGSVAAAKAKYANARTAMNALHASNSIVTDRSGYSREISLDGLTDPPGTPDQKIRLLDQRIDNPDDNRSIATLMHESMHAGNADVGDSYAGFDTDTELRKLTFANCFEVIAWRILDPKDDNAFPVHPLTSPVTFQTFVPAGTTVHGVTAAPLTPAETGSKAARELYQDAWTNTLNLHSLFVQVFKKPTDWTVPQTLFANNLFSGALPFWSKVEKLTIHEKTVIDPASPNEAKHPVSQIDIALSEGLIRRLSNGYDLLSPQQKEADILSFELANAAPTEVLAAFPGGAHTNAIKERDFLLKLATRNSKVGPMTGSLPRDLRVVKELGTLNWGTVLDPKSPSSFPG